jgi:hypothetical protein
MLWKMGLDIIPLEVGSMTLKFALACFVLSSALYIINALFLSAAIPKGVPLIREPPGKRSFSWKTRLAYYTDCESLYREAYQNVCFLSPNHRPTNTNEV